MGSPASVMIDTDYATEHRSAIAAVKCYSLIDRAFSSQYQGWAG